MIFGSNVLHVNMYAVTDRVGFLILRHNFKLAAMTYLAVLPPSV